MVGPWDLGNSIGHPIKGAFDPELENAIEKVLNAAIHAGKKAGIVAPIPAMVRKYSKMGFHMVRRPLPFGKILKLTV